MINILNSYLAQHKSISIPGLGAIYLDYKPAVFDITSNQLLPPRISYKLGQYFDSPDKAFFTYLAGKRNISDIEAIKKYNEFAYELRENIRIKGRAEWPGIGVFLKDERGETCLDPEPGEYSNLPVQAIRLATPNMVHTITVGDRERTSHEMTKLLTAKKRSLKIKWGWLAAVLSIIIVILFIVYLYHRDWMLTGIGSEW